MQKFSTLFRGLFCLFMFLLIVVILASWILETNRTMVDDTLGTQSVVLVTEEDDGTLFTAFTPDEEFLTDGKLDTQKDVDIHKDLGIRIQQEGSVLLKNVNALPLLSGNAQASSLNVSVLGRRGYDTTGVAAALETAGVNVNPAFEEAYSAWARENRLMSPGWASNKTYDFKYNPLEMPVSMLGASDLGTYDDAAIVVLGRSNAEGADYKPGGEGEGGGVADGVGARNALALSQNERDLLEFAKQNSDKVIVLINTVSAMELHELKTDDGIDAIMYIGLPATYGAEGVANLLLGKANPSGGLYDTYAADTTANPAMMNFGHFELTNAADIERADTSSVGTRGTDPGFTHYLIEAEGIYAGSHYYETRYYDSVVNKSSGAGSEAVGASYIDIADSDSAWDYADNVTFSFGYGLSYSTFAYSMSDVTIERRGGHEVYAKFSVTVTNTSGPAGKTPVQIYAQSPYTEYDRQNLVEKSAVQLMTFDKTDIIQPGASETIEFEVDLQELASYDANNAETYIMEEGTYWFAVGNGAHDALNNILAAQNYDTGDGMDYNGNAAYAKSWEYVSATDDTVDDFTFAQSKAGVEITNQLDYADWNDYEAGKVTYLTRKDWDGTWPRTYSDMTAPSLMVQHYSGNIIDYNKPGSADADGDEVVFGKASANGLKFAHMKNAKFDDPRWQELIDQISMEEAILFAIESGRGFAAIDSINFPEGRYAENGPGTPVWYDADSTEPQAPWKVAAPDGRYSLGSFPTYSVIASTFSRDLAYEYGRVLGNDAIFGEKPLLWLPGANLHRTAYAGRSEQYFSENPVLTGIITMEAAYGAWQKGAIVTAKHFAFNDQEMHRSGVGTFQTEQRAREMELRGFQIAFEANKYNTPVEGERAFEGMQGVMTSFSKLGGIECTVNEGLLTGVLRGEWGYHGYIVSDLKDDLDLMPQAFLAGLGGYDWRTFEDDIQPYMASENFSSDAGVLNAIKEVVHEKLWVFANSSFMNRVNATTHSEWNMTWWRGLYIAGIAVFAVCTAACLALYVVSEILGKKKEAV